MPSRTPARNRIARPILSAILVTLLSPTHAEANAPKASPTPAATAAAHRKSESKEEHNFWYAPHMDYPLAARRSHMRGSRVFLLNFRPDGTVASITVTRSTGHAVLDEAAERAFFRWRARPGVFKQVSIPIRFNMGR